MKIQEVFIYEPLIKGGQKRTFKVLAYEEEVASEELYHHLSRNNLLTTEEEEDQELTPVRIEQCEKGYDFSQIDVDCGNA